ncbi:hypothetical protein K2X33_09325 [bacterium]|nr:hypothetical protein [bacterium]
MPVELTIEHVNLTGQGVGKDAEGNLYFVEGALPGDRVLAQPESEKGRYRDAALVQVVQPSPERVDSVCPVFGKCGGCDWLDWDYASQVRGKEKMLQHVLGRSNWEPKRFLPSIAAEQPLGYRNRIQLRAEGKKLGFYRKRSHDIVDIENCAVADPRLNEALTQLRGEGPFAQPTKIELAVGDEGKVERLDNSPHAAAGFAQVHSRQNNLLREMVRDIVQRAGAKTVLELFAGNGNLTMGYAEHVERLFAVDSSAPALEAARAAWKGRSQPKAAFLEARVDKRLVRRLPGDFREHYDTLLLDPPRSGTQECLGSFLHDNLKTIVYVSCSPVAFTKDVQCLEAAGFQLEQVQIIDMFPHTRHIEFVSWFSRSA